MTTEQRGKEWNLHFTKFMFISPHILTEFVDMVFGSKYFFHFHDSGVVVSNSCKPSGTWEYCNSGQVSTFKIFVIQTYCSNPLYAIQHTWSNIHNGIESQTNLTLVEHLAPAHVLGQLLPQRVIRLLSLQDHVVQVLRDPHLLVRKEKQCKGSVVIWSCLPSVQEHFY